MIAHTCLLKAFGVEKDVHQIDRQGRGGDRDGQDHGLPPGLKVKEVDERRRKGRVKELGGGVSAALRCDEDKIVSARASERGYNLPCKEGGMIVDTENFLTETRTAKLVRLPVRAVVGRGAHSLNDVRSIAEARTFETGGDQAELEVSGVVLARGRIVRKGNRFFFKVAELGSGREGGQR
jgi:flagellar motor switch/type III secretory pathway protein FliN